MSKKPFACKIGLHSTYSDASLCTMVDRCNNCDWVSDKRQAAKQDNERAAIAALPSDPPPTLSDMYRAANASYFGTK